MRRSYRWVALPLLAFALFSLTAGQLAAHQSRSKGYFRLFFQDPIHLKAAFATAAAVLGCFRIFANHCIFKLGFPVPVLPIAGGTLFAVLTGVWYSALWLYTKETPAGTRSGPGVVPANAHTAAGKAVFAGVGCADCHTLRAAHSLGQIGPNLDDVGPSYAQVQAKVNKGRRRHAFICEAV